MGVCAELLSSINRRRTTARHRQDRYSIDDDICYCFYRFLYYYYLCRCMCQSSFLFFINQTDTNDILDSSRCRRRPSLGAVSTSSFFIFHKYLQCYSSVGHVLLRPTVSASFSPMVIDFFMHIIFSLVCGSSFSFAL